MSQFTLSLEEKQKQFNILKDYKSKISDKYKALFCLKSCGDDESIQMLKEVFNYQNDSAMLKHEIIYVLGQLKNKELIYPYLVNVLANDNENYIVRHEAAEAIANFGDKDSIHILRKYLDDNLPSELYHTCILSIKKLEKLEEMKEKYGTQFGGTIEPAAPFSNEEIQQEIVKKFQLNEQAQQDFIVQTELLNKVYDYIISNEVNIFEKYRALYYLRDLGNQEAITLIGKLLHPDQRQVTTSLMRHEICFILGEMSEKAAFLQETFEKCCRDPTESEIVKHEALLAWSSIKKDKEILKEFLQDESQLVRETVEIALDLMDYWFD